MCYKGSFCDFCGLIFCFRFTHLILYRTIFTSKNGVTAKCKKKEKQTIHDLKTEENKQKRMKKSTHKTAHPAKNAQLVPPKREINRTNLFCGKSCFFANARAKISIFGVKLIFQIQHGKERNKREKH
jgi:hypothetical protein